MAILAAQSLSSQLPQIATMAQGPSTPWRNEEEAEEYALDPKGFLQDRCSEWIGNIVFMQHYVFCATYYLPAFEFLPSGQKWHRAEISHDEAAWQGKVGLVLGKGPMAFKDDDRVKHHDQNVEVGDWVWWDVHDARQYSINRVHCRYIADVRILGKLKDPKLIY